MNRTLVQTAIAQMLAQPVRLGALAGAIVLPLLQIAVDSEPRLGDDFWTIWLAVIASAGVIGLESSSGAMALLFTRPIGRGELVLSRWAAASAIACSCATAATMAEALLVTAREGELTLHLFAVTLVARVLLTIGVAAVFTCFSALTPSLGDLVVWGGANIVAMSLRTAGSAASMPWLSDLGTLLRGITIPALDVWRVVASPRVPWAAVTGYAATILLALSLAIVAMNRKELSYASE